MALLDKLNQQRQAQPKQQLGQTEAAQSLLQAKTGKAGTAPTPVDTEAERAVAQEVQGNQRTQSQQGAIQGAAAALQSQGIQQQENITATSFDLAKQKMAQDRDNVVADLQMRAVQAAEKLGLDKQQAAMEARLFEKRISNEKYIQTLSQEASEKRLQNQSNFKLEIQKQVFGEDLANLLSSQEYSAALGMNDRAFQEYLNKMSAKDAWKAAVTAIKQQQTRDTMAAFTGGASMGMQYGGMMGGGSKSQQTTTVNTTSGVDAPSGGTEYASRTV